jgi:NADH-quinone oxidoreductase subunit L
VLAHLNVIVLTLILAPLCGSIVAGIFGKKIGRKASHCIAIFFVAVSFVCALMVAKLFLFDHATKQTIHLYHWAISDSYDFGIGLLIDSLTAMMMLLVTFVSLFVHLYSIGYMEGDDGYQRFFSYVSLFTFAMLCLVGANDFVMLFFGWEGVGLVSYLLIGFWFHKESAVFGSLKAFIANRVGDLGFLLAIGLILSYFGSLDYDVVFAQASQFTASSMSIIPGVHWSLLTVISILLFVGAAGKSAQVPLHIWLPESMEGPTPISALIHAATMVTAGVYMLCRMSPLIEYSQVALSVVLILGAVTCLFMGILGIIQHDIKRVIAYSTLSQLGYMMIGVGSSAYGAGLFHLFAHGCFKALLFLAAGSVIIGMKHDQDMRNMGGLWRYMPITWLTFLVGGLALAAIPPFAGFYSKDTIIAAAHYGAVHHMNFGATFAYWCALLGAFVTAVYTFRAFFLTFHGKPKFDQAKMQVKESPWVVTVPLVVLAIPAALLGMFAVKPLIYASPTAFGDALFVLPQHNILLDMAPEFTSALAMFLHSPLTLPFWFAIAGVFSAWIFNLGLPKMSEWLKKKFKFIYVILQYKYGFDDFNQIVLVRGTQKLSSWFYTIGDLKIVDGWMVNGSGRLVLFFSRVFRRFQTGYLNHYALAMVAGLFVLLAWIWVGLK